MKLKGLIIASALTIGIAAPHFAAADSELQFGSGATATANLDFRITIDQFVFFRVGTNADGTVDRVDWDLTGVQPGESAAPIAATGGTGDGADGVLTIQLITNASQVTLASNTGGGDLVSGTDTIPFTDINVADGGTITAPAFDGNVVIATGGVYSETDDWTFTYNDDTPYVPGVYDGTSVYTAATP